MKLLVVDDEKHVREAIRLLIDCSRHDITEMLEAADGRSAIQLVLEHKPEIIITDMIMPMSSGALLLEWLNANAPESKTVVVSGHDDFALVRHTVRYGGTDYILKPIDPEQLNDAVSKAAAAWKREETVRFQERQRRIEINEIKPVFWDKQLSAVIRDPGLFRQVSSRLEREFGMPGSVSNAQIVSIRMDTMEMKLRIRFGTSQDLLVFSLVNICNEFMSRSRSGVAFRYWDGSEIVLLLWKSLERTPSLLEEINEGMVRTLRTRLHFGIGGIRALPLGLSLSHQEALTALRQRNLLARDAWLHQPPVHPLPRRALSLADYEEDVQLAVRSGSAQHIQASLLPWFEAMRRLDVVTLEQIDHWQNEYSVMRRRWLRELFPEADAIPSGLQTADEERDPVVALDENGKFSITRWQQEFTDRFLKIAALLMNVQHKDKNGIHDIAKYIEAHYHEEISLQDIATRFFLSREYISRKFKLEFGVNLSDFLTDIRMKKARLLLANRNLRIADIADAVGYQDEKYFSKVFKKASGCSPAEYRKQAAK